jgi:transposase
MFRAHGLGRVTTAAASPRPPRQSSRGLSDQTRHRILRFLRLGWTYTAIAKLEGCSRHAVRNVMDNLDQHGALRKPPQQALGRRSKISSADGDALFEHLIRCGWLYQDEIIHWLAMERGITCSKATVSRYLSQQGWKEKTLRPFCILRNEELRNSYRRTMRQFAAEDLVFLDESIFNEKTGWRHKAYGPVGEPNRYTQDIKRGKTHAILPAFTINGYLPCTGVKEGYFSHEDFIA